MKPSFRSLAVCLVALYVLAGLAWALPAPSASPSPKGSHSGRGTGRMKAELGLTDEQAQRLEPMLKAYRAQRKQHAAEAKEQRTSILTPEQRAQVEQSRQERSSHKGGASPAPSGQGKRGSHLNLTDAQKTQMRELRERGKATRAADQQALFAQTRTVLNPDQETRFEQMMAHPRSHHGGGSSKKEQGGAEGGSDGDWR